MRIKSREPKKLKGRVMRQSGPREQRKYKKGEAIKQKISQVINLGQMGAVSDQSAAYNQYNPQYAEHRRRLAEIETNAALQRASYEEKINELKREEAIKTARAKVELDKIKLEAERDRAKIRGDADIDTADTNRLLNDIALENAEAGAKAKKKTEEMEASFTGLLRGLWNDLTAAKKEADNAKASGDSDASEKAEARVEAINADMAEVRDSYNRRLAELTREYEDYISKQKERADSSLNKLNATESQKAFNLERTYDTMDLLNKREDYLRLKSSRTQQIRMISEEIEKLSKSTKGTDIAEMNSLIERSNNLKDQLGYINNQISSIEGEVERKEAEDKGRILGNPTEPLQPETKDAESLKQFEERIEQDKKRLAEIEALLAKQEKEKAAAAVQTAAKEKAATEAATSKAKGEASLAAMAQAGTPEITPEQMISAKISSIEAEQAALKAFEEEAPKPKQKVIPQVELMKYPEITSEEAALEEIPIESKSASTATMERPKKPTSKSEMKELSNIAEGKSEKLRGDDAPPLSNPEQPISKKDRPAFEFSNPNPPEQSRGRKKPTMQELKSLFAETSSEEITPPPERPAEETSSNPLIEGLGIAKGQPTSDEDLSTLAKRVGAPKSFLGVYTADELKKLPTDLIKSQHRKYGDVSAIVNTKPNSFFSRGGSGDAVGHWCAIMIDGDSAMYYDPFGDPADKEILRGIKHMVEAIDPEIMVKLKENGVVNQDASTNNCGFFALKFLSDMWAGEDFKEATGFKEIKQDISGDGEREVEEFKKIILSPREFNKFL